MSSVFPYSLIILAGGKNSRFGGKNKAFIQIENKTIIQRIIDNVGYIFSEIIIVTNSPEDFSGYKQNRIITDIYKNKGPLAGLHAALTISAHSTGGRL